jgi:hypothetical protein
LASEDDCSSGWMKKDATLQQKSQITSQIKEYFTTTI